MKSPRIGYLIFFIFCKDTIIILTNKKRKKKHIARTPRKIIIENIHGYFYIKGDNKIRKL